MSTLYSDNHRKLQDQFDSRRMADFMELGMNHAEFASDEIGFIESRDMFFLSTVDANGFPTVSYKGGDTGFVRITGPSSLVFPVYNGNGMHYSMGNIVDSNKVGLLFIDFETPHRLRVHGTASLDFDPTPLGDYPGAEYLVRVDVTSIWINCPRYVHRYQKLAQSKYVPKAGMPTPVPAWKRIDVVQSALPAQDQGKAESLGGEITIDQYVELVGRGEA